MKLILFLFQLISILSDEKIIIPFEIIIPEKITLENIIEILSDIRLITKVKIGSNKEELNMLLDLNKYPFYISGSNTSFNEKFDENLSNSFKVLDKEEIKTLDKDFIKGYYASDNILLNNLRNINLSFILSTFNEGNKSDVIGLQFASEESFNINMKKSNIIKQLQSQNLISNNIFYFKFNEKNKNKGELIIGKLPNEFKTDLKNYKTAKVSNWHSYFTWRISLSDVKMNNKSIYEFECNDLIVFNSNSLFIKAPKFFLNYIDTNFFSKESCQKVLINFTRINYFYCDEKFDISKFPDLLFIYDFENQLNFTLSYKELFYKVDNKYIFLIITGTYDWEFGISFLQKYETIFNQDMKTIGWYESKENYTISILLIVTIIILIAIIIFLIMFMKRNIKRKVRKNEIYDNYEYISDNNKI